MIYCFAQHMSYPYFLFIFFHTKIEVKKTLLIVKFLLNFNGINLHEQSDIHKTFHCGHSFLQIFKCTLVIPVNILKIPCFCLMQNV